MSKIRIEQTTLDSLPVSLEDGGTGVSLANSDPIDAITGANNPSATNVFATMDDLYWTRVDLGSGKYQMQPITISDSLKFATNIVEGTTDAYSRNQIWNYNTDSILRLGSLASDGDPTTVASEGEVVYGKNCQGDTMTSDNFGYVRLKPTRIGLYNSKNAGYVGYLFRVDTTTNECYFKDNSGVTTLDFDRSNGDLEIAGTLTGTVAYTPTNPDDWGTVPDNVAGALDTLAADKQNVVPDQSNIFYFRTGGDNDNSGANIENAVASPVAALVLAATAGVGVAYDAGEDIFSNTDVEFNISAENIDLYAPNATFYTNTGAGATVLTGKLDLGTLRLGASSTGTALLLQPTISLRAPLVNIKLLDNQNATYYPISLDDNLADTAAVYINILQSNLAGTSATPLLDVGINNIVYLTLGGKPNGLINIGAGSTVYIDCQDSSNLSFSGTGTHILNPILAASQTWSGTNTFSSTVNLSGLTASQLLATDGSKNITNVTALPNGTTATTQSSGDNSTKVATTAYVDAIPGIVFSNSTKCVYVSALVGNDSNSGLVPNKPKATIAAAWTVAKTMSPSASARVAVICGDESVFSVNGSVLTVDTACIDYYGPLSSLVGTSSSWNPTIYFYNAVAFNPDNIIVCNEVSSTVYDAVYFDLVGISTGRVIWNVNKINAARIAFQPYHGTFTISGRIGYLFGTTYSFSLNAGANDYHLLIENLAGSSVMYDSPTGEIVCGGSGTWTSVANTIKISGIQNYTKTVTWTGPWSSTQNGTIYLSVVNKNVVVMQISSVVATADGTTNTIYSLGVIPSGLRPPAQVNQGGIWTRQNNTTTEDGDCQVDTSGNIYIFRNFSNSFVTTNSQNCGFYGFTMSWLLS